MTISEQVNTSEIKSLYFRPVTRSNIHLSSEFNYYVMILLSCYRVDDSHFANYLLFSYDLIWHIIEMCHNYWFK